MRDIVKIIDEIIEVAPDLEPILSGLRSKSLFKAPEVMGNNWTELCVLMNSHAQDHPKKKELIAIVNDTRRKTN